MPLRRGWETRVEPLKNGAEVTISPSYISARITLERRCSYLRLGSNTNYIIGRVTISLICTSKNFYPGDEVIVPLTYSTIPPALYASHAC